MPWRLPISQAELEGPCWGWRVQASLLPLLAFCGATQVGERKWGGGRKTEPERGKATSHELQRMRKRRDVDTGGEVEKVKPEQECERNAGNEEAFLWLETENWEGEGSWRVPRLCKTLL